MMMHKTRSLSWDLFTGLFRPPENFKMNVIVFIWCAGLRRHHHRLHQNQTPGSWDPGPLRIPGLRIRTPGSGPWVLDPGIWIPGSGSRDLEPGIRIFGSKNPEFDQSFPMAMSRDIAGIGCGGCAIHRIPFWVCRATSRSETLVKLWLF